MSTLLSSRERQPMRFLQCYPFADPRIRLVEGFAGYNGLLGDTPGDTHHGIDFILPIKDCLVCDPAPRLNNKLLVVQGFKVHAMHDGYACQGTSDSWGRFVVITHHATSSGPVFRTVYAHLTSVKSDIPQQTSEGKPYNPGRPISAGDFIGQAGDTGATHGIIQLHIELLERWDEQGWKKVDPYGLTAYASSGLYPQPGQSLSKLHDHWWISNDPPLARNGT